MSDISLHELEKNSEELKDMPSGVATDTDDIPDQSTIPDFGGFDGMDS